MLNDLKTRLGQSITTVRRLLDRPVAGASRLPADAARTQGREERHRRTKLMRRELYTLLEQHPDSRALMRHLDVVERTLRTDGLTAVEALPLPLLAKALGQLERLVWDWSPAGLADLRSRLAILVKAPRPAAPTDTTVPAPSTAATPAPERARPAATHPTVDISEVDHAVFEEMERSWHGRVPAGATAEPVSAAA
jgi:hypothetical protein